MGSSSSSWFVAMVATLGAGSLAMAQAASGSGDEWAREAGCERALAGLETIEAALAEHRSVPAGPIAPPLKLIEARRRASVACLGKAAAQTPQRGGEAMAPQSVPSVTALRPAAPQPVVPGLASQGVPAVTVRPPVTITTCDAVGCFTSDGSRVTGTGPILQSPRGACTRSGAVLNCP